MSTTPPDASPTASTASPDAPGSTDAPAAFACASYMGCRHCEEGNLVWDAEASASRCRSCGALD